MPDGIMAPLAAALPALAPSLGALSALDRDGTLAGLAFAFVLVFARVGTAVMLLPGVGELWVPARIRLTFALAVTLILLPPLMRELPALPGTTPAALIGIVREVLVGFFIGFVIRVVLAATLVAGSAIALQAGLANALQPGLVNPDASDLIGIALGLAAITVIVNTGLDHQILVTILESYRLVPASSAADLALPLEDLAKTAVTTVGASFKLGIQLSLPVLTAAFLVNIGLGLANRFMQQLQAYFLSVPLAAMIGLGLTALAAPELMQALVAQLLATLADLGG